MVYNPVKHGFRRLGIWTANVDSTLLVGIFAHWPLDEESGTRYDTVDSNHLTDNNTVGFASGKIGNAASFVASNGESLTL